MAEAPSPQAQLHQHVCYHADAASGLETGSLQSFKDQWSQLVEGGCLEGTQNAALERALSSLLDLLGTATSVSEDQLTLVSDVVCTVLHNVFGVDGRLCQDPHADRLATAMSRLTFQAAQAAFELPLTAVPLVSTSMDQLLGGSGAANTSALAELSASFLASDLTTAAATSPSWLDKAGEKAFSEANARLRGVLKDSLVPALACCMAAAGAGGATGVEAVYEAACGQLFQQGRTVAQIVDGASPLSGRREFRSFATLNVAWNGLVKVLLAVPPAARAAFAQLEGFCLAECLGVLLASLDATLQPLLRDMKPTQLQIVRFWVLQVVKLSDAFPGPAAEHWHTAAALLGLLAGHRSQNADPSLQPLVEQHVTQRLADVVTGVFNAAAAADGGDAADAGGRGAVDSDLPDRQLQGHAAALLERLCVDAAGAGGVAGGPSPIDTRRALLALLALLGRAGASPAQLDPKAALLTAGAPPVARLMLARRGLAAVLAGGSREAGCNAVGRDLLQEASDAMLGFLAACCAGSGSGGPAAQAWSECQLALLTAAADAAHPGQLHLLTDVCSRLFRRSSDALCDSFLEALTALARCAALASASGKLPSMQHLPELLGSLLAAAPPLPRDACRARLLQEASRRIAAVQELPVALAYLRAVQHSCDAAPAALQQDAAAAQATALAAARSAIGSAGQQPPAPAVDLPVLLECLEAAASIVLAAAAADAAEAGSATAAAAAAQQLAPLAVSALRHAMRQPQSSAVLLPAVRLCVLAARAVDADLPSGALPVMLAAQRHGQAQQAVATALRHCDSGTAAQLPALINSFHAALEEPRWLVRHAAMEALVDVLRATDDLDPRTLVPPALLPNDSASPDADCSGHPFVRQLQLYMHRSPPPAADSSGDIGGDRSNSGSGKAGAAADAATADSKALATEQAELQRRLAGLRAPLPMPPAVASQQQRQSGAAVREQQIRAALAHCWECLEAATATVGASASTSARQAALEVAKVTAAAAALQSLVS